MMDVSRASDSQREGSLAARAADAVVKANAIVMQIAATANPRGGDCTDWNLIESE
jgi:hypothetical protein